MDDMMAYCGILCHECPAYKATLADDWSMRKKTAEEWSGMFNTNLKPEDIHCLGCKSDVLFDYCKTCDIRSCILEKDLEDCGKCESFSCSKVENILKHDVSLRERLEQGRK